MNYFGELTDVVQLLRRNADEYPDRPAIRVSGQGMLTWSEVDVRARMVGGLLGRTIVPGDRVVLSFDTDVDFLSALFGCWYAGAVAVPVPPGRAGERAAHHAGASMVLTTEDVGIAVANKLAVTPDRANHHLALIQYTSGSTGAPKGVQVTHRNYMQNLRMLDEFYRSIAPHVTDLHMVCWLPHFHDMGFALLMYTVLRAGTATLISPMSFLKDPSVWLRTIGEVGGNLSAAPNFAFDLCIRRVPAEILNLTSMGVILNAAEPVRPDTVERFAEHFEPAGFRAEMMAPCYGLAEATVFASGVRYDGRPRMVRFHRGALQTGFAVEEAGTGRPLVSCGRPADGLVARIVNPSTRVECGPGELGEIWLHGPNLAEGYWRDDTSPAVFAAQMSGFDDTPYLRTGDRGFHWRGELFVTGRLADLIEADGWLLQPEDIEHTVERSTQLLHGRRCAIVPYGPKSDRLALLAEVRVPLPLDGQQRAELESAIREAVTIEHDITIAEIRLVPTGTIPVTTSGKVQRVKARDLVAAIDTEEPVR
ncbi:acyl-CoA synthetase [Rugosimonospora africana]|uniref:Acyl-CoA synthetase n=2 Tax=Rugosimonospora africana TaxID=556532 RepID=A0A8J3R299_9ACTN|nr:acyl-CoA synthetase [Rugosimonospora africana]